MTSDRRSIGDRLYVCGPMTNEEGLNIPAFEAAGSVLRAAGFEVVLPHECGHGDPDYARGAQPWAAYMHRDLPVMLKCDAIVLLQGWPSSRGAMLELNVAASLDKPVFFLFIDLTGRAFLISMLRGGPCLILGNVPAGYSSASKR